MSDVELAKGWVNATFVDVVISFGNGIGGNQSKDGIGIPVSRIETIADQNINFEKIGFIAEYDSSKIEKYKLNHGDILFSHINSPVHLGKTAIFEEKKTLYHGINLLRIIVNREVIYPKIFNYYCKLTRFQGIFAMRAQHAVNQSSINQKKLGEFEIPLAPLPEQKRIAHKLDTVLARVDACSERLSRVSLILKRFKQSVLAAATSGKLTKEWCDLHARDQNWTTVKFGDILNEMRNGLSPKPSDEPIGKKIFRISAVRTGRIDYTDYKYLVLNEKDELQYSLASGDLLFTRYNGSLEFVGVCALVGEEGKGYVYPDKLIRVRVNKKIVDAKYIQIVFGSSEVRAIIENFVKSTSGQKGISGGDLKSVEFELPTLLEQHEIVRRVEILFAFADRLEARLTTARNATERLTPALLAKAFRGELVEQDPNDEPAADLLRRLATSRETKVKTKKTHSKVRSQIRK